jgi:hypothetical protein
MLICSRNEWLGVYQYSLESLKSLLLEQHARVVEKKEIISYVSWIGQYCDSKLVREAGHSVMQQWEPMPTILHHRLIS